MSNGSFGPFLCLNFLDLSVLLCLHGFFVMPVSWLLGLLS